MSSTPKKTYLLTTHKIHILWEQANRLIALHEELAAKITLLEDKLKSLNSSVVSTVESL